MIVTLSQHELHQHYKALMTMYTLSLEAIGALRDIFVLIYERARLHVENPFGCKQQTSLIPTH
jgi:hypothetical protein